MNKLKVRKSRWAVIGVLLIIAIIISAGLGAVFINPLSTLKILLSPLGLFSDLVKKEVVIIWQLRLPRILASVLVGAALAASGAAIQGLFRNPMASPEVLGISAGGSLGALISIHTGLTGVSLYFLPLSTALGASVSTAIVYVLSTIRGKTSLLFIILAGLAISSFMNGLISLVLIFSKEYEISQFIFWTMGSLESRRWTDILVAGPFILVGIGVLIYLARDLNMFLFGEDNAHSLGLDVDSKKKVILLVSALLTGAAVSISGSIGFVGLIVPHLIRLLVSTDNRYLIPASALGGGLFLLVCDTIGRTIMAPFEIRVGIITALLGAPYFISLLLKYHQKGIYGIFRDSSAK